MPLFTPPRYQYDCDHCNLNWNCGYASHCAHSKLPAPPDKVKCKVNLRRWELIMHIKYKEPGAVEGLPEEVKTKLMEDIIIGESK